MSVGTQVHARFQVGLEYTTYCYGWFQVPLQKVTDSFRHILSLQKSDRAKNGVLQSCLYLSSLNHNLREFESFYPALWVINYISVLQLLSHKRNVANISLLYRYFHRKFSDALNSLVPLFQVFTDTTHHVVFTGSFSSNC